MKRIKSKSKLETDKKGQFVPGWTLKKAELNSLKLGSFYQRACPETNSECIISFLDLLGLSHPENIYKTTNILNYLHQNYGNAFLQEVIPSKPKIDKHGDIYEQEADKIAEQVIQMSVPHRMRVSNMVEKPQAMQIKSHKDQIFIDHKYEEKPDEGNTPIQIKHVKERAFEPTTNLISQIQPLRGSKLPLSLEERRFFEPRLGCDFSQVRVHADNQSARAAEFLNAKAFTIGRDIFFGNGQYSPKTRLGKRLLAHELSHVMQQRLGNSGILARSNKRVPSIPRMGVYKLQFKQKASQSNLEERKMRTRVKQLIKEKNEELYALIKDNPLDENHYEIGGIGTNNKQLAVSWEAWHGEGARLLISITRFDIILNKLRLEGEKILEGEELTRAIAESLFHELTHVLIEIEKGLPPGVTHTRIFETFQKMLNIAKSSLVSKERMNVKKKLEELIDIINKSGIDKLKLEDELFEHLINEKYTYCLSASYFGRIVDNAFLAEKYADDIAIVIQRKLGSMPPESPAKWDIVAIDLKLEVEKLYDKIDQIWLETIFLE